MSIGYNISHQHVGLTRTGRYRESVRHIVPAVCRNSGVTRTDDRATDHSRWRRISGITCAVEECLTPKQRRAGIARLVERMKIFALAPQPPLAEPSANDEANADDAPSGQMVPLAQPAGSLAGIASADAGDAPSGQADASAAAGTGKRSPNGRRTRASGTNSGEDSGVTAAQAEDARLAAPSPGAEAPPSPHGGEGKLDFVREWDFGVETWARVGQEGRSVEGLCALFQISRARLTALTKEFCGLSAQEMLDGFKIKRLKQLMAERLREAAEKLWGGPGDLAFLRACMPREESLAGAGAARRSEQALRSAGRDARATVPDFYGRDIGEERENRKAALVAELKKNSDFESAAVRLGFGSAARMNRACLNVFGRSLRELESFLAGDVVMYYLTAEVKYLREMASRETAGLSSRDVHATYRAREFYDGSEDAPTAPYCDLWSAAEYSKGNWLEAMAAAFG